MPKQKSNRQPGIHLHRTALKSVKTGKFCEWYWILIAKNGKTIAKSSETYKRKAGAVKSLQLMSDYFFLNHHYYDHTTRSGQDNPERVVF